jgi:4-hydroxy-tetrahydrodipicolinate reductase
VVIEFTHPEPSLHHLREVTNANKAMVLGTTGFSPGQVAEIHALGARTRLVFAPNMSVGVNLMFKVVADIAKVLQGYDVEIVEAHHRLKKDAPSGTALKLAQVIAHAWAGWKRPGFMPATASSGQRTDKRSASRRCGRGHRRASTRCCSRHGQSIEIIHRAHSRQPFRQAQYGQPSGSSPSPGPVRHAGCVGAEVSYQLSAVSQP